MMKIAQRAQRIEPFYVMEVAKAAAERAALVAHTDAPMIFLNIGEPDFTAPPLVQEAAARAVHDGVTQYTPALGISELRERISAWYSTRFGVNVPARRIVITAGASAALQLACLALIEAGDEVIIPAPYWVSYPDMVLACDGTPVTVVCPEANGFKLTPQQLADAITPRTRAILTVSPNNPTGAVYSEASLRAINALCAQHGLYHFSDEAYEYFTYEGVKHFSPASIPGAMKHTLSFYSMSKNYGMASWRVGYVVFPADLFDAMNKVQDTNLICAPMPSQLLAIQALKQGRNWVAPKIQALSEVRQTVYRTLEGLGDLVQFPKTQGAFYVLMKLPGLAQGIEPIEFNRAMTEKFKVASIPGFAFGLTQSHEANYQRLSYGALEAASVAEGVQRYVAAVKDWYKA